MPDQLPRDDILGVPRSLDELERTAAAYRELFRVRDEAKPDLLSILEGDLPSLLPHFALVVRADSELPNDRALALSDPPRIEVRESTIAGSAKATPSHSMY
jgi:hypothetical protein